MNSNLKLRPLIKETKKEKMLKPKNVSSKLIFLNITSEVLSAQKVTIMQIKIVDEIFSYFWSNSVLLNWRSAFPKGECSLAILSIK